MIGEFDFAEDELRIDRKSTVRTTAEKVRSLKRVGEDMEWYPTTPEILDSMKTDLWAYLRKHKDDYASGWRGGADSPEIRDDQEGERLDIDTFLDIGAGDGRVLDFFDADKKYGIEIARVQADDLIRKGVFIIGRNYWDVSLINQEYSLVFSNPPFSVFEQWINKMLIECNFCILYLVMPVRWQTQDKIIRELERYETTIVGEFDFSQADREARGKVHLVRVNAPWIETERVMHQETLEHTFSRWVREYIADFTERPEREWEWEEERQQSLALKMTPIDQLVSDYDAEKKALGEAFKAIGKLEPEIINLMGQDKKSMLEIIRKAIEGLKSKYWRAAFNKLEPVQKRMTLKTRERIFRQIEEFKYLDFNADNIYSIIIWIINNSNIGILDQIGEVFDAMTTKEYIAAYKSNRHWATGDWRNTCNAWNYKEVLKQWKLGLDYRIVVNTYFRFSYEKHSVVDDFIVICRNLGFPIACNRHPDYTLHAAEQKFYTEDGELAFTMRYYTGNKNTHLKINKKLLMKFNIEVAKIRKWMSNPGDVAKEFDISTEEAVQLWNSSLNLLGSNDIKMLECKEAI